jgi:hypothetical protein
MVMSKQTKRPKPVRPDDNAPLSEQSAWLLRTYAFCPPLDKVVDMYKPSAGNCMLTRDAFAFTFRGWCEVSGKKVALATHEWTNHKLVIDGIMMRPDMPFPLYEENGEKFKNIYCQPEHTGTGDLAPFMAFMERFLPDKREREWLYDEMAHKQGRPEIPGTAVLFVADTDEGVRTGKYGTGRGFLFKIVHKLYGENYAMAQSFDTLDGSSSQAVFNDWMHNRVLVTINEAKTSATSYRRGERNAVYEVLKDKVDPAPQRMDFKGKYRGAFNGMSYCTFWVACNHADAIAIPANDRRFTVLRNGREMTPAEAKEIAAWMEVPGNIAELSRFLAGRDLKDFNMYQPLDTTAKQDMAGLSLTQVEGILRDLMEDPKQGLVFTRYQMEREVAAVLTGSRHSDGLGQWRGEFEGAWNAYCVLLKTKAGSPSRMRVMGRPTKLYCFRTRLKQAEKLPEAARHASARKRGGAGSAEEGIKMSKEMKEAMENA